MKKYNLIISTMLKTRDPAAATVKSVLAEDMGWKGRVSDVGRKDLWVVEYRAGSADSASEFCRRIVHETWFFYNPNKHILEFKIKETGGDMLEPEAGSPGVFIVSVLTRFKDDEKEVSAAAFLRGAFKPASEGVSSVKRFVLWRLELNAVSGEKAVEAAYKIARTETIESGLLANPNSQDFQIIA